MRGERRGGYMDFHQTNFAYKLAKIIEDEAPVMGKAICIDSAISAQLDLDELIRILTATIKLRQEIIAEAKRELHRQNKT